MEWYAAALSLTSSATNAVKYEKPNKLRIQYITNESW